MTLHAQMIRKEGKNEFVVLPYKEFLIIQGLLEDFDDLRTLRRAKSEEGALPGKPLENVMKDLRSAGGISGRKSRRRARC